MRHIGGAETTKYVLVDGNNMLHKAYHVFVQARNGRGEPLLCNSSGYPTGVIYGSLMMLSSWLRSIPSITKVCVFFDGWPKRRKEIDPTYKSDRLNHADVSAIKLPLLLRDGYAAESEMDVLRHLLLLLGCDLIHHPEEEADDLIASFIHSHPGAIHIIISDDKDFFQLLTNSRVVVFRPGSSSDIRFFDAEASEEYWGKLNKGKHPKVPATHVRMFKSLCGDPSDSIPGVDRLRKRVAVPLCASPDVDSLLTTGLPGFSKTEREKTLSMVERLRLNFALTGLYNDIDVHSCRTLGSQDFAVAGDIIRDDLGISTGGYKLDLSSFRLNRFSEPVSVPLDDWLCDL